LKDRIKEGIEGMAAKKIKDKVKGDKSESSSSSSSSDSDEEEKKGLKDRIKEGVESIVKKVRSHKKDKEDEKSDSSESSSSSSSDSDEGKKKKGLGHKIKAGIAAAGIGKYGDKIADKIEPENNEGIINKARGVTADALHAYAKVEHLEEDIVKEGINLAKDVAKEELHLSHEDKNVKERAHESYDRIKEEVVGLAGDVIDGVERVVGHHEGDEGSSGIRQKIKDTIQEGIDRVKEAVSGHGHAHEGEPVIDELSSKPEDVFKDESQRIGREDLNVEDDEL